MLVLGIESSCDETGAAIVKDGRYLLSNVVASQIEIHNRYGGVVPEVASRQQLSSIIPVIETALDNAACSWEEIDAVGATFGPGLAGSLLVGLTVGKALALAKNLPFVGVNHLEAHIYANWLRKGTLPPEKDSAGAPWDFNEGDPMFPLICLVVSGAHSELVLVKGHGQYELLGRTRDDAAGEAFDKVARVLQQKKPVELARSAYRLPRAWLRGTYDFSFSGLKTAMLHLAEGATANQSPPKTYEAGKNSGTVNRQRSQYTHIGMQAAQKGSTNVALLAASFQEAVVDVLAVKTRLAAQEYHVKQVVLAGGVAANLSLRARLEQELLPLRIRLSYPPVEFCTDNAAMIASAAYFHLCQGEQSGLDLDVQPGLSLPFRKSE